MSIFVLGGGSIPEQSYLSQHSWGTGRLCEYLATAVLDNELLYPSAVVSWETLCRAAPRPKEELDPGLEIESYIRTSVITNNISVVLTRDFVSAIFLRDSKRWECRVLANTGRLRRVNP